MEDGLGWEHSVKFVCLAFQNALAAQINGFTVHRWAGIPAINVDNSACGDRHKQSLKCAALRVIIIDEARDVYPSCYTLGTNQLVWKSLRQVRLECPTDSHRVTGDPRTMSVAHPSTQQTRVFDRSPSC